MLAGEFYRVGRLLRRVDACGAGVSVASQCGRLFEELSDVETRRVGRLLAMTGDDGAFVLGELDDAGRARLLRLLGEGEMDAGDVQAMARMLRGERGIRGKELRPAIC